jgi:hypothetical protein
MPAMKVTPDAAMRARDVSRPRAEDLLRAEEAQATAADAARIAAAAEEPAAPARVDTPDSESPGSEDRSANAERVNGGADGTRRRRVRGLRSSARRGRPSR